MFIYLYCSKFINNPAGVFFAIAEASQRELLFSLVMICK